MSERDEFIQLLKEHPEAYDELRALFSGVQEKECDILWGSTQNKSVRILSI